MGLGGARGGDTGQVLVTDMTLRGRDISQGMSKLGKLPLEAQPTHSAPEGGRGAQGNLCSEPRLKLSAAWDLRTL